MNIALVSPASLPATQFGGIMFLALDIARQLSKNGENVTIYTTDLDFANNPHTFNKNLPREEKIEKFIIKRSHVIWKFALYFVNPGIKKQMMKDDIEIIHTFGIRSYQSYIAALVSKNRNIPLIISDQSGLTTHPDLKEKGILFKLLYFIQKPFLNFIINQSSKIIVANEYESKIFEKFVSKSKISIVKNGVDLEKLKSNIDFKKKYNIEQKYILFLGRFNKVKGIDIFIKAIKILEENKKIKAIKILILGVDFGYEKEMYKLIQKHKLEKIIQVIKNPPREDVISAYKNCEFLVLPSRWELSPLTPLEGFAFKKAVISNRVHGIPYTLKDKENCLLVEPESPQLLSDAIMELLNDSEKSKKMGELGFNFVTKIGNSENMAKNTLKVYKDVLKTQI
jgi:glycosyltransferase involved in cell wall biosynthesis